MNDSLPSIIHAIEKIMRHEGLHEERIRSFLRDVGRIAEGELSLIREASIAPIHDLPEINAGEESGSSPMGFVDTALVDASAREDQDYPGLY